MTLVLDPATDLVDAAVGDADDVEGIGDTSGMAELGRQPRSERLGQVGGHHLDAGDPVGIGIPRPSPQVSGRVALDHVDEHLCSQVDQTGGVDGGVVSGGLHMAVSVGKITGITNNVGQRRQRLVSRRDGQL